MLTMFPRLPHKLRNDLRDLHRGFHREEQQRYLAEGQHICSELLSSSESADVVVVRDDALPETLAIAHEFAAKGVDVYACGEKDMALVANAVSAQSIVARVAFHTVRPIKNRVVMLDGVADPGNVGTIIRCAAWFGFTDVVLVNKCADVYNPKVVRSASGATLRMNVVRHLNPADVLNGLSDHTVISAIPHGGEEPSILKLHDSVVLIIGSEAHGISKELSTRSRLHVTIPGSGQAESLNAAMAAAILMYEARSTS